MSLSLPNVRLVLFSALVLGASGSSGGVRAHRHVKHQRVSSLGEASPPRLASYSPLVQAYR